MINFDAAGRMRMSETRTLFDGKLTTGQNALIFEQAGTGSHTIEVAGDNMVVTPGQWCVFNGKRELVYSSGKSQIVEQTFDSFAPQSGVKKITGYFDTSTDSPYTADIDGFWLESAGDSIKLIVKHADYEMPRQEVDIKKWTGYDRLRNMRSPAAWAGFTVIFWDFLWLGGANLRLFVMTSGGWALAHQYIHAGRNIPGTMMKSPSKTIRNEIRSTGGSGSFRYICSQGATEGDISDNGYLRPVSAEGVTIATPGTVYPLLGLRKNAARKNTPLTVMDMSILPYSVNDRMVYSLQINPILSGSLSWVPLSNSSAEFAAGNGTVTVQTEGAEILSGTALTNAILPSGLLNKNFLSQIGSKLDGTSDEYWICGKPQTATISLNAYMNFKEF